MTGALSERIEKVVFEVNHHEVLVDQVVDTPPDLARQLGLRQPHRLQLIDDLRLKGLSVPNPEVDDTKRQQNQ